MKHAKMDEFHISAVENMTKDLFFFAPAGVDICPCPFAPSSQMVSNRVSRGGGGGGGR